MIFPGSAIRKIAVVVATLLLLFNGAGAIYGGVNLILYPDGSSIQLDSRYLDNTPFDSYFIPGLLLFVVNGLMDIAILVLTVAGARHRHAFVVAQGVFLGGWLLVQVTMIKVVAMMHLVMGATAVLMIVCGFLMRSQSPMK